MVLYFGTLFAPNVYFLGAILFVSGLFNSIRTNVSFLYMIELMPKKYRSRVGTFWNCFEGSINLFATAWLMFVSIDGFWFMAIGALFQIYACCMTWFLPESPSFLL